MAAGSRASTRPSRYDEMLADDDDRRRRDRDAGLARTTRSRSRRSRPGKHVFIEKPLAASSAECVELIQRRRRQRASS